MIYALVGSSHRTDALEFKSTGEHRTAFQQSLFRVIKKVVGPLNGMTKGLVPFQATPRPDQQFEPSIETIADIVKCH